MPILGKNIIKEFGDPPHRVLHEINVNIQDGEFVSISGKSGSGKSTLLYILSTLDSPTRGEVHVDGMNIATLNDTNLHSFRNLHVGFIFQFHYLLPELSAIENILLGPRNIGQHEELRDRAHDLLRDFDIFDQADKLPSQMSGGQQQRVAIARSLIMNPRYLFADEPTGNLDTTNGQMVMDILKDRNKTNGTTVILVTHEPDYSAIADREIHMIDGQVVPNH
ncbi:MAG: ABC transporter ATP-binding protein [Bdellovibrionaceae bacterium]|nr:ABC transporter ATP-binding protein [Bdellovibrionales bacterium]MCB9085125.1 ABC transporter ATP-binding protein [Pseudobdellovibrionaceae bacterium]